MTNMAKPTHRNVKIAHKELEIYGVPLQSCLVLDVRWCVLCYHGIVRIIPTPFLCLIYYGHYALPYWDIHQGCIASCGRLHVEPFEALESVLLPYVSLCRSPRSA